MKLSMVVNGVPREIDAAPSALLVDILRSDLRLTGTHVGCDTSQCGACTVRMNGRAVKSCTVLAGQAEGAEVTTIEGLGAPGALHPLQAAFQETHGLQCGFCTPGMIMAALDLVESGERLDETKVREGLAGNLCRCTGYHNIVRAVLLAAGANA
ncbi:MAG TPA: (2Fe-2S)-binding protein [Caulobacteraceae bacterium]|nr:(2Fe-2S)-binding protein [Caulobacteraceae bacterium]